VVVVADIVRQLIKQVVLVGPVLLSYPCQQQITLELKLDHQL
jgi:hypothetical protein